MRASERPRSYLERTRPGSEESDGFAGTKRGTPRAHRRVTAFIAGVGHSWAWSPKIEIQVSVTNTGAQSV
jgi:hypothetical protein